MELRQLRQFLALAEAQNFHRAAAALNMAQPPLSVSIRKLEEELGVRLVERHTRGVTLTREGDVVAGQAREIMRLTDELRRFAKESVNGTRGNLRLGFVASATYDVIPRLAPAFRERYPAVRLRLSEASSQDIVEGVLKGDLHVGIVRTPLTGARGVELTALFPETMLLAIQHGHRFEHRAQVDLAELRGEPLILTPPSRISGLRTVIDMSFSALGFAPNVVEETHHVHTTMSLVESGLGAALLPSTFRRAGLGRVRLVDLVINGQPIEIGMATAVRAGVKNKVVQNFVALASELLADPKWRNTI